MYGVEWLILLGVVGLAVGALAGYLLATRGSGGKRQLEADLAASREALENYRESVVTEFSETARKFQALNDAYTDLHRQLARSSQTLCGDITGPLLEAPAGHQDVIPADVRERVQSGRPPAAADETAVDPYEDDAEIRVPEPGAAAAAGAMAGAAAAGEAATDPSTATGDGDTAARPETGAPDAAAPVEQASAERTHGAETADAETTRDGATASGDADQSEPAGDAAGVTDSAAPGATAANETPDHSETASGEPATTDDDATAPERKAAG